MKRKPKQTPVQEWMDDFDDDTIMKMDGFDHCIIGVAESGMRRFMVYDKECVLASMMNDGMSREDAIDFYEYNQLCAYVGEGTPVFLYDFAPNKKP